MEAVALLTRSFGAMLKKKAKVSNPNATLDFSACRDLNGRRFSFCPSSYR